jgi:hypothetical protein
MFEDPVMAGFGILDVVLVAMTKIWGCMKINIDELLNFDR